MLGFDLYSKEVKSHLIDYRFRLFSAFWKYFCDN